MPCISSGMDGSAPFPPHMKLVLPCLVFSRQGTTLERAWQLTPAWVHDPGSSPFRPPEPEAMCFVAAAVLGRLAAPCRGAWACPKAWPNSGVRRIARRLGGRSAHHCCWRQRCESSWGSGDAASQHRPPCPGSNPLPGQGKGLFPRGNFTISACQCLPLGAG